MAGTSDSLSPALERVLANFSGILRSVCWRYHFTGDDVDELVQEVRIRLWRAHGELASTPFGCGGNVRSVHDVRERPL